MHEAPPATPASADASAPETLAASTLHQNLHQDMEHLSETIGPRGSATEDEAKAAHYVAGRLSSFGLTPQRQDFNGAASAYAPYALATFMGLLSLFLFWQQQFMLTVFAIVFTAVAVAAMLLELSGKDNVLRWVLYKDDSQNVFAEIKAKSDAPSAKIVVTAHLDSHRTPLIFSSPRWVRFTRRTLFLHPLPLAGLLTFFVGWLPMASPVLRWLALVPGIYMLMDFVLMLQADTTLFTKGANDNASGVAVGLALASRLAQSPLEKHDVILVFTGCEETGGYGADAFFRANKATLKNAIHLVIRHVGGKNTDPCFARSKESVQLSDLGLLQIAEGVIAAHPDLNAHIRSLFGSYNELSIGALHNLRTLGIFGFSQDDAVPHWRQPTDTLANVDIDATARATELAWLLLQAVDQSP
jgi:hypothetical protein